MSTATHAITPWRFERSEVEIRDQPEIRERFVAEMHDATLAPSPVLYVTYAASALHERSGTHRKLESIAADFAAAPSAYRLAPPLPTQRGARPLNCSLHAPARAECAEVSRSDMKRAVGHELALHRRGDAPRRLNVGFWVCAIWLVEQCARGGAFRSCGTSRTTSTCRARGRPSCSDMMPPAAPRSRTTCSRRRYRTGWRTSTSGAGTASPRSSVGGSDRSRARRRTTGDRAAAAGRHGDAALDPDTHPRREAAGARRAATLPAPPLPAHTNHRARAQVTDETLYAKVPLYAWRMRGRLATEVARALIRGAKAHEEFFVPTVCRAVLHDPPCRWATFAADDVGVPCGSNVQDAWYRANRPELSCAPRAQPHRFPGVLGPPPAARRLPAAAGGAAAALPPRQGTAHGARAARRGQCDRVALTG